jgi:hypothetical protein
MRGSGGSPVLEITSFSPARTFSLAGDTAVTGGVTSVTGFDKVSLPGSLFHCPLVVEQLRVPAVKDRIKKIVPKPFSGFILRRLLSQPC